MKLHMNHYIVGFPVQLYGVEEVSEGYNLTFSNLNQSHVEQINLAFGKDQLQIDVNTKEKFFEHYVQIEHRLIHEKSSQLTSVVIEGKTIYTKDFEQINISPNKSVHSLGYERSLYQHDIADLIRRPKKEVVYLAENNDYYWNCVCGHSNLSEEDTCHACGIHKKELFSKEILVNKESVNTRHWVLNFRNLLIWLVVTLFFQIAYQSLLGDFLFTNNLKNQFLGVLNRVVMPLALIALLITAIYAKLNYKKKAFKISVILSMLIYIYMNLMAMFYFVGSSYNFMFVIAMNIGVIGLFVYDQRHHLKNLFVRGLMLITVIFSISNVLEYSVFGQYNIRIETDGIYLYVETDETSYTVPEQIGGIDVTNLVFIKSFPYVIEDLTISKNIQNVYYTSAIVLSKLDTIILSPENPYLYLEDNILYRNDGSIEMVPISIQSLYINDETILEGPFKNLINLKSLTIGKDVKTIENEAFIGATGLESITFEETSIIESIGERAFAGAEQLTEIYFPISLQTLGVGVLEGADSLESLTAPFIGHERETSDVLAESTDILVYFFGSNTFLHNNLVPSSLTYVEFYDISLIHNVTFYRDSYLEEIVISSDLSQIGIRSFYGTTNLISFTIPNGVTVIPQYAFEWSGIKTIVIPATVTEIEANAFKDTHLDSAIYLGNISELVIDPEGNQSLIDVLP